MDTSIKNSDLENLEFNRSSSCFDNFIQVTRKDRTNIANGYENKNISTFYFINNLWDLEDKSPENVAEFIKFRFLNQKIYTWGGQTLIAVHPYEDQQSKLTKESDPSINNLVSNAWFKLSNKLGKRNQCIVISGDSGSGKTYSASKALQYLASQKHLCEKQVVDNILVKAWSSGPVLTAFGNASTVHNCNSSRFGKLLQLQCKNGKIVGAFIETYLLERSRVSGPNEGETNFHIFNQILEDLDSTTLASVYLSKNKTYKIAPKLSKHRHTFRETLGAMESLNIFENEEVLKVLSLILNMGNIEFINDEERHLISKECNIYLENCTKLLKCDSSSFARLFIKRLFSSKFRRSTICYTTCINVEECQERRNSLMRFVYDKLFMWLVRKINPQIHSDGDYDLLGILDIYGFETFKFNTFEQLCINYANERMQQYFVKDFHKNQEVYEDEIGECPNGNLDLSKYDERINLLDGTLSVFGILNEECLIKRYNSDIFIGARLSNALKNRESFINRINTRSTKFSIKHYAGVVEYDCMSMVNKNRDKVPEEMVTFLRESDFKFLLEVFNSGGSDHVTVGKTLLSKFKKSLDNLMITLNQADVHYIKCLKPNLQMISDYFDKELFIEQLKYNGIMDTLSLKFQSYSIRMVKKEFTQKFGTSILDILTDQLNEKIYSGKDNIYFKTEAFNIILKCRSLVLNNAVRKIQKIWKKYFRRKKMAVIKLQRQFRNVRKNKILDSRLNDSVISTASDVTVIENKNFVLKKVFPCKFDLFVNSEDSLGFKPFYRNYFTGDRIVSKHRLAQIPVRFHLKKTCLPFSHILPKSERATGLSDIL